jgi:hypothetical protein
MWSVWSWRVTGNCVHERKDLARLLRSDGRLIGLPAMAFQQRLTALGVPEDSAGLDPHTA